MSTALYPHYTDIKDWVLLESRTIHAYNDDETPIEVVKLQIGELEKYELIHGLAPNIKRDIFPIIRWISKPEYDSLCRKEGTIIW